MQASAFQDALEERVKVANPEGTYWPPKLLDNVWKEAEGHPTCVGTESGHGLLSLGLRVEVPCLVRLLVGSQPTLESNIILACYGLPIKDEERHNTVLLPMVQIVVDVGFDASEAAKSREQRFVSGRVIEKMAQVIGCIDCDCAVLELGNVMGPARQAKVS